MGGSEEARKIHWEGGERSSFKERVGRVIGKMRVHHFGVTLGLRAIVCGMGFNVFLIYVWIKVLR